MARDWRRAGLAALAAAMLGGVCALGSGAQAADKQQDPAEAQRRIEAALKRLKAGGAERAVRSVSDVLEGGNLPPALMAKAFYVRGMAHRREDRPAQAVSDLNAALWLRGGLGGDERAKALKERSAAYADAGLRDPGGTSAPATPKADDGGGNWLSGLFGGASSPPPSSSPPRRSEPSNASQTAVSTGGWTTNTEVRRTAHTSAAPSRRPAARSSDGEGAIGRYLVQVGALRTEAKAEALAARARREHATLAELSHSIDRVSGSKGTFYRVRFGPFASATEIKSVCAKLQNNGLDCMPVIR